MARMLGLGMSEAMLGHIRTAAVSGKQMHLTGVRRKQDEGETNRRGLKIRQLVCLPVCLNELSKHGLFLTNLDEMTRNKAPSCYFSNGLTVYLAYFTKPNCSLLFISNCYYYTLHIYQP